MMHWIVWTGAVFVCWTELFELELFDQTKSHEIEI